jgi:hypothetical protein
MKNLSKRKTVSMQKKQAHRALVNPSALQLLVNSLNETRDEESMVRMLKYSSI